MHGSRYAKTKKKNYTEYRKRYLNEKLKSYEWYCDVCKNGKKIYITGKSNHLRIKKKKTIPKYFSYTVINILYISIYHKSE